MKNFNFRCFGVTESTTSILGDLGLEVDITVARNVAPPSSKVYDINLDASDILSLKNTGDIKDVKNHDLYEAVAEITQKKLDERYGKDTHQQHHNCVIVPYYDIGVGKPHLTGDAGLNATSVTIKGVVVIDSETIDKANQIRKENHLQNYGLVDFVGMAKKHIEWLDNLANERYLSVVVKTNGQISASEARQALLDDEVWSQHPSFAYTKNSYSSATELKDKDGLKAKAYGMLFVYNTERAAVLNSEIVRMAYNLSDDIKHSGHKITLKYDDRLFKNLRQGITHNHTFTQYIVTQVYHTFGFLLGIASSISVSDSNEVVITVDMDSIPSNGWLMHHAKTPMSKSIVDKRTKSVGGRNDFNLVTASIILDEVMGINVVAVSQSDQNLKAIS